MLYLLVSFALINSVHVYLLISQRHKRGLTISEHAAKDLPTHMLYIFAHGLGGLVFLGFAWNFFYVHQHSPLLLLVTIVGVLNEWLQALVPARRRYVRYHEFLAYGMSAAMALLALLVILIIPMSRDLRIFLLVVEFIILCGYPLGIKLPRKYFWIIEMVNINLFYLVIFLAYRYHG